MQFIEKFILHYRMTSALLWARCQQTARWTGDHSLATSSQRCWSVSVALCLGPRYLRSHMFWARLPTSEGGEKKEKNTPTVTEQLEIWYGKQWISNRRSTFVSLTSLWGREQKRITGIFAPRHIMKTLSPTLNNLVKTWSGYSKTLRYLLGVQVRLLYLNLSGRNSRNSWIKFYVFAVRYWLNLFLWGGARLSWWIFLTKLQGEHQRVEQESCKGNGDLLLWFVRLFGFFLSRESN